MLRLIGSRYHFRRAVPKDIQPLLRRSEISLSLDTSAKLEARRRAAQLYDRTGQFFDKVRAMSESKDRPPTPDEIITFYESFVRDTESAHAIELRLLELKHEREMTEVQVRFLEFNNLVTRFLSIIGPYLAKDTERLETMRKIVKKDLPEARAEAANLAAQVNLLKSIVVEIGTATKSEPIAPVPLTAEPDPGGPTIPKKKLASSGSRSKLLTVSKAAERFIYPDTNRSEDTKRGTRKALNLFIDAFGDMEVERITGETAGEFRDLLFRLPSTHGKERNGRSIRDEVARAETEKLETISAKTVKNHFSRLSALWALLLQRDLVSRNVWAGWDYHVTKKVERRCFSDAELTRLSATPWSSRVPSARTAAAIINIAAYTGMRLGEICNLRCADIEMMEGVACFQVRPHSESGWSPKTQAGTRIVPIHPELIAKGILSFMKPDQVWLFPDLVVTKTGDRSASFSQAFARLRSRAGLPREVCFHSFRHTVSTKLRNTGHELREIWIDRLLGHEATHRSQGTMNYTSAIDVPKLKRVIEAINYETLELEIPET